MDLATIQDPKHEGFSFGVCNAKLAAELRKFADDIASYRVNITDVRLIQRTSIDDFYHHSLIIRFNEKITQPSVPPPIGG